MKLKLTVILISLLFICLAFVSFISKPVDTNDFISYQLNPKNTTLKFYWKDDSGKMLKSLQALKKHCDLKNETLLFGMNGGMYKEDNTPLGLFIAGGKVLTPINKKSGSGNFYMQPNGILYIAKNKQANICTTDQFQASNNIEYATQSGPMLLIDGKINTAFKKSSVNINIRNGVGLLPNNNLVFAMSKQEINFYNFAEYFEQIGCTNALYLDGFVSRTYLPQKNWVQLDGNFGVLIGAIVKK